MSLKICFIMNVGDDHNSRIDLTRLNQTNVSIIIRVLVLRYVGRRGSKTQLSKKLVFPSFFAWLKKSVIFFRAICSFFLHITFLGIFFFFCPFCLILWFLYCKYFLFLTSRAFLWWAFFASFFRRQFLIWKKRWFHIFPFYAFVEPTSYKSY